MPSTETQLVDALNEVFHQASDLDVLIGRAVTLLRNLGCTSDAHHWETLKAQAKDIETEAEEFVKHIENRPDSVAAPDPDYQRAAANGRLIMPNGRDVS